MTDLIQELETWIVEFLNVPNDAFNGMPVCPFANKARITKTIRYTMLGKNQNLVTVLEELADNWVDEDEQGQIELHIVMIEDVETRYDKDLFLEISDQLNEKVNPMNLIVLDDHPHNIETVDGVELNFGKAGLMIMNRLDVLNKKAKRLATTEYYDKWSKKYLEWVVLSRFTDIPEEFKRLAEKK